MKKEISLKTQMFWRHIAPGLLYTAIAVFGMFSADNLALPLVLGSVAILLVGLFSMIKGELEDEMAEENYTKAKASTTSVMHHLLSLSAVVFLLAYVFLRDRDLNWVMIAAWSFYALMGIQSILIGLFFNKWEAE